MEIFLIPSITLQISTIVTMIIANAGLCEDGKRMILPDWLNTNSKLDELYWISQQEFEELQESGDNIKSMSCPYKIQPENQGKFIWISGHPGAGKSTTAQLLSRNTGFVYYEADCVMTHANPYIPTDVENPSIAQMLQKHLKVYIHHYLNLHVHLYFHWQQHCLPPREIT